jgi:hypothetical protein
MRKRELGAEAAPCRQSRAFAKGGKEARAAARPISTPAQQRFRVKARPWPQFAHI